MESSLTRLYLTNTLNETHRSIDQLRHRLIEFDTVLADSGVRGKERNKIRSRRFKAVKMLESLMTQMQTIRCALAETEVKARVAESELVSYFPPFLTYPPLLMDSRR
jgi:hypothetical protein